MYAQLMIRSSNYRSLSNPDYFTVNQYNSPDHNVIVFRPPEPEQQQEKAPVDVLRSRMHHIQWVW